MALETGSRLGPYEILGVAGAGGMGEVYRAKDTRLDRTVAIKVLPMGAAEQAELRSRLEREAKAISSLNHPHICTLFDVGHQEGSDFLVMEYIEGETLAARLEKGPLATPELLKYAIQIADALDKAHRQGLVHRDLKPGNIMLTKAGAKLLDFGLAKLTESSDVIQGVSGVTRSTPLTGAGTILGTLHYMSPEQLEGKEADARSDIFAFGCVLYEMATGERPFDGKSQASLIASILKEQPRSITERVPLSPPMLERVIRQCMEKDAEDRWNSAGDLKLALEWVVEGGSQVGLPAVVSAKRRQRERGLWIGLAALAILASFLTYRELIREKPVEQVVRFALAAPARLSAVTWPRISPDGTTLAFTAQDSSGRNGLWLRPLNTLEPHLLLHLEGASSTNPSRPFWSPDSKHLAYFEGDQLKKVSVAGGLAQLVCQAEGGSDGAWGSAGIIVFDGATSDSIRQVPASGGRPAAASIIDRSAREGFNAWPTFLPDGEHFLYLASVDTLTSSFALKVGSVRTLESRLLGRVDARVEYSASGHLVYVSNNVLVAHPFDAARHEFTGEPVPLANEISSIGERSQISVSDNGTMVYQRGEDAGSQRLVWLSRNGDSLAAIGQQEAISNPALSPDGSRLAYTISDQTNLADIWVRDLKRDVTSRLTFGPGINAWPLWSTDGTKIYFASNRGTSRFHAFARPANGTGPDEEIIGVDTLDLGITDLSRDGRTAVAFVTKGGAPDIAKVDLEARTFKLFTSTPSFAELRASLSPDGKYLAYESNESGESHIYVREFSPTGGKWQISAREGRAPQWRADGRELYYLTGDFDFMAVPISYSAGLEIGTAQRLFNRRYDWQNQITLRPYQVTADGQRILLLVPAAPAGGTEFIVVQNWPAELGS